MMNTIKVIEFDKFECEIYGDGDVQFWFEDYSELITLGDLKKIVSEAESHIKDMEKLREEIRREERWLFE